MKKQLLLLCLFHYCTFVLNAQTQDDMSDKCCVFVGTSRTENTNCQPPMMYTAIATESDEECKTANKQFRLEHPNYDAAYCHKNNMSVIVITYTWKKCSHKGVAQIYESTLEKCKETLRQRVDAGYYNYDYDIIYQWGNSGSWVVTSNYFSGIMVDFYTLKESGKVFRIIFHNNKEKKATAFVLQPNGDSLQLRIKPGNSMLNQVFETGIQIKISFEDYNEKEVPWDIKIINKLKGEVREQVVNPRDPNKKVIFKPSSQMGVRG